MDLTEFAGEQYELLEQQLEKITNSMDSGITKFSNSIYAVTIHLDLFKKQIQETGFKSAKDEIACFKTLYPKFYSWYIYLSDQFNIVTNIPTGTEQMVRDYYLQELGLIKRYFNQNQFLYQYYLHEESALDADYFLRKSFIPFRPGFGIVPAEENFTTNQGYTFAKFRAFEMLEQFLINRIKLHYHESVDPAILQIYTNSKRQWTGEKINLIEIAYGIFYTGQMNNGKADLKEIIAWLESSLNVDLSQAYRMFIDIRRRKTVSYTKFLEMMATNIQHQIKESLIYKPRKKN